MCRQNTFTTPAGSQLFERITELPEYYPTRCEISILRNHGADIAKLIPSGAALVEFGSGSSKKARILLSAAPKLAAYVPVDICGEMIEQEAAELRPDFPDTQDFAGDGRYLQTVRIAGGGENKPRYGSDFFQDRRSAISSRMKLQLFCATRQIFSALARSLLSAPI